MPKLIARFNYIKGDSYNHKSNYIHYLGTRENVELYSGTDDTLPALDEQKKIIEEIVREYPYAMKVPEYEEFLNHPSRKNASLYIHQVLEGNMHLAEKKSNYMEYLAKRPRSEAIHEHGLFSYAGSKVDLEKVMKEVADYKGVLYTTVLSMKREDAERLSFDNASRWQNLVTENIPAIAENFRIRPDNLKWYAAFHNESHHPHIHLVVYSKDPNEGYLSKNGIKNLKSIFAHQIFENDLTEIYGRKTEYRNQLKKIVSKNLYKELAKMNKGFSNNEKISGLMLELSNRMKSVQGKKVYGYLSRYDKRLVDMVVDELQKDKLVSDCYEKWLEETHKLEELYKDTLVKDIPISKQKELKSIRNDVIRLAVQFAEGTLFHDDDQTGKYQFSWSEAFQELKKARSLMWEGKTEEVNFEKVRKAIEQVVERADEGNLYSCYEAGMVYLEGTFVEKDISKALHYLENAASQDSMYAQYQIGKLYYKGQDVERDWEKAFLYFEKAAAQGHEQAKFFMQLKESGQLNANGGMEVHPDLLLMTTRLLRKLEKLMQDSLGISGLPVVEEVDSKLLRKLKEKKTALGHAKDDKVQKKQTQGMKQ